MRKSTLFVGCGIATMVAGAAMAGQPAISANTSGQAINVGSGIELPAGNLYDNGAWDGINGYSDIVGTLDRTLLDDFTVPAGGWDIGSADTLYIWGAGGSFLGTDLTVEFYADNGNCTPDTTPIAVAANRVFVESDPGLGDAFGRPIMRFDVTFDTIHLDPGHYWVDLGVVGNDTNGFILTAAQNDCACWVDYADFGGRAPGINIFGVDSDIVFGLGGGGPSDCLTMTVSSLIGGTTGQWDVSGATPGSLVAVVFGLNAGSTVINGQLGFCATFGISGINQNSKVGTATADGAGNATVKASVPAQAAGLTVLTQAAEQGTCPNECVSGVDTQVVQ